MTPAQKARLVSTLVWVKIVGFSTLLLVNLSELLREGRLINGFIALCAGLAVAATLPLRFGAGAVYSRRNLKARFEESDRKRERDTAGTPGAGRADLDDRSSGATGAQ